MNRDNAGEAVAPGLWLVATPIGNLDDLSPRAVRVLCAARVVCCEDSRRTGTLLKRIGASPARLIVANDHTEFDVLDAIHHHLAAAEVVAFVTDAGTPGISDPGERAVRAAVDAGHPVHAVPGPAAFVMALVLSGLPTARIAFDGFLPRTGSERRQRLTEVARERRTVVLYEAPHRLGRTVTDLAESCGADRRIALARELTKMHEEVWRGTLAEAVRHCATVEPRGEYVLVLEPLADSRDEVSDEDIRRELTSRTAAGLSTRDAVDEVTTALGVPRKRVYTLALDV